MQQGKENMMKITSTIYYMKWLFMICICLLMVACTNGIEGESISISTTSPPVATEPMLDDNKLDQIQPPLVELPVTEEFEETQLKSSDNEQAEWLVNEESNIINDQASEEVFKQGNLPQGFVYLDEVIPSAQFEMRYYSNYNFVGARIDGYLAPLAIGTSEMAGALSKVSDKLEEMGYQLLIYDTYRPAKAVQQFLAWSKDSNDIAMKEDFYPNIEKAKLFKAGYLSSKSGHSRGSTVDLTLIYKDTGTEVDMGSPYDLLDEISHFPSKLITAEQTANRQLLQDVMVKYGFKPYSKEWWHFVLNNEPYPSTYYDFDVQ